MNNHKLENYIGIGLVVIAILAFILTLLASLPRASAVADRAHPLPDIPSDLLTGQVTAKIKKLTVPSGVPVVVDPSTVGRTNVFENF